MKASIVGYGNSCDEIIIWTCKTLYPHHETSKKRFWNGQTSSTRANKIGARLYNNYCGRYPIKLSRICHPMCTCIKSSLLFVLWIHMSPMYQYWYVYTTISSKCWRSRKNFTHTHTHTHIYIYSILKYLIQDSTCVEHFRLFPNFVNLIWSFTNLIWERTSFH